MKRIILLISVLLLSASWMFAQYGGYGERNDGEGSHQLRVEGCLYGQPGYLVLLDNQGNAFQLAGRMSSALDNFVGYRVRVAGRSWFNPDHPYAMGANEENGPTLHVSDIEHISRFRCGEGEHHPEREREHENKGMHIEIPVP
jgi:hypothetical protein